MTEQQWQQRVLDLAKLCGWRSYHPFDSRRSTAGWPDLALVRAGRLVLAELKTERGRVTPEQRIWLAELSAVPGLEVFCWRPSDWAKAQRTLARDPLRMALDRPTVHGGGEFSLRLESRGEVASGGRRSSIPPWPVS